MSTRVSIRFETDEVTGISFHIYEETFDYDHVYLETVGLDFEASSSFDEHSSNGRKRRMLLKIPTAWAEKLRLVDEEVAKRQARDKEE